MTTRPPQSDRPSDEEFELLSAYLDDELETGEREALMRRLEREPALRTELDELYATTTLLRELPVPAPPRSFTLDPATVRPRRPALLSWLAPFAGGLAGLSLILLVAFSLFSGTGANVAMAPVPESALQYATAAPAAPAAPEPTLAPEIAAAPAAVPEAAGAARTAATEPPAAAAQELEPLPTGSPELPAVGAAAQAGDATESTTDAATAAEAPLAPLLQTAEALKTTQGAPPAIIATSGSSSPGTQNLPPPPPAPADQPADQANPLPSIILGAGITALGILLGLWLGRMRRRK